MCVDVCIDMCSDMCISMCGHVNCSFSFNSKVSQYSLTDTVVCAWLRCLHGMFHRLGCCRSRQRPRPTTSWRVPNAWPGVAHRPSPTALTERHGDRRLGLASVGQNRRKPFVVSLPKTQTPLSVLALSANPADTRRVDKVWDLWL